MSAANNSDLLVSELKQNQNSERVIFKSKHIKEQVKERVVGNEKHGASIGGAFANYNLSVPILKAIKNKGYNLPTPIQRKAIPAILQGFNVIAMARTGSGKTGAFVIPLVDKLKSHCKVVGARAVILSPTREIAMQTASYFRNIAKYTDLTLVLITGGNDMEN
jgi:ATP-dependent RNA helicase DDX54/DBP10